MTFFPLYYIIVVSGIRQARDHRTDGAAKVLKAGNNMTVENTEKYKAERRTNRIITIALVIAGSLINYLLFTLVNSLGLPLYLDNVGSILASVLGGYIPGIFAGFLTNIINCFTDPTSIYYGILTVLIAAVAAYFEHKKWLELKKPHMVLLFILILTLIGGGLGTILPWMLDGLYFDSESIGAALVDAGISNLTLAQLLGNLIMDALDKTITTVLVLAVKSLIPARIKEKFVFDGSMQAPLDKQTESEAMNAQCRRISVRTKIMAVLITALLLLGTVATAISYILFSNAAIEQHTKLVEGVANVAAGCVDGDMVDTYLAEGEDAEGYAATELLLANLCASDTDIQYVYVYKIMDDGCHVVFDVDTEETEGSDPGEVIGFDEAFRPYLPALLAGEEIDPIISDETYGWLLTVYKPIYDSTGRCAAYAAADVSMSNIVDYQRNFITGMVALFLLFFVVIFAVVLWIVEYHIVLPLNSMSMVANKFAYNSDDEQLNANVEKMEALRIHTGDEIENLYNAVLKTAGDSVAQVEAIRQKNETISKMQNALILVLADIVESRDKNTGDHVRKTAAYTRVIMKKMKELNYYPEELTDRFIENVGNSAPMHDIGKIKVSDIILNKPGRLTDEEFVLMQAHTTYGKQIIDEVIDLVPESDYLQEAKNLAYYHHEKWNGKGYPTGIAGENIPLSARIMAVADVFDALVSKRSYKEPFSFEQAQNIIREGAGSHFDPLVADAFLKAEDDAKKIAEAFGDYTYTYAADNHVDDSGKMR
mgnify:CR=1 FL=1